MSPEDPKIEKKNHSEQPVGLDDLANILNTIEGQQQKKYPTIHAWARAQLSEDPALQDLQLLYREGKIDHRAYRLQKIVYTDRVLSDASSFLNIFNPPPEIFESSFILYKKILTGSWSMDNDTAKLLNPSENSVNAKVDAANLAIGIESNFAKLSNDFGAFRVFQDDKRIRDLFEGTQVITGENCFEGHGQTSIIDRMNVKVGLSWMPVYSKRWNQESRSKPYFEREAEFISVWQGSHPDHFANTSAGQVVSPNREEIRMIDLFSIGKDVWLNMNEVMKENNPHNSHGNKIALTIAGTSIDWLATVSQFAIVDDSLIDGKGVALNANYLRNGLLSIRHVMRTYDYGGFEILDEDSTSHQRCVDQQRRIMYDPAVGIMTKLGLVDLIASNDDLPMSSPSIEVKGQNYQLNVAPSLSSGYQEKHGTDLSTTFQDAYNGDSPAASTLEVVKQLFDLQFPNIPDPNENQIINSIEGLMSKDELGRLSDEPLIQPLISALAKHNSEIASQLLSFSEQVFDLAKHPELKEAVKRLEVILAIHSKTSINTIKNLLSNKSRVKLAVTNKLLDLAQTK